jgi:hypothetical protein
MPGLGLLNASGQAAGKKPATSCILLMLTGGPSQLDTWDMKPEAPSEIRGPFRPIKTNVPGIEISEIFPLMARHADKYVLVRSVWHDGPSLHDSGSQIMQPGRLCQAAGSTSYDLRSEPESSRLRYGLNTFGQNCLMARRLVETGSRFVAVNMFGSVFDETTWDIHGYAPFSPISCYRDHVGPMFDAAYSSLLEDLSQRGLLESTLVVAMGEFGRTPKINPAGGRDHWTRCSTVLMAGGGVRGGQVYGSSDRIGAEPKDDPVDPAMLAATIYKVLGFPPAVPGAAPIMDLL